MSISHAQCCHTANKDPCSSLLPRCPVTHCPICPWNPDSTCMPFISSAKRNFIDSSSEASSVVRGARVLARNEADGYYYLGHIAQEVKGSRERFLIEFDKSHALKGKVQLRLQETPLYDILHYEDARQRPLAPGDRVLAPWEARAERFGPGTVLKVVENKEAHLAHNRRVIVNFWNGQTKDLSADQALWIPLPLSERIILELQMPLAARQMVVDSSLDYPYIVTPGYRASGHHRWGHSHLEHCPRGLYLSEPCTKCSCRCTSLPHCCLSAGEPTWPAGCKAQQEDAFVPGTDLTKQELSKKIEEQLSEMILSSTESVSREEEKKEEKKPETENVPRDTQSCLEEDNELIEPKKKSILNGRAQKSWKEMAFNKAKIEHKRRQEEQRQLKREQQQEADSIRRQLCRDNQRQQLHQRRLQELEKQLEHRDRALQHMALLQAARAEKSRKESSLTEEEKRKASQRLQFLKTQYLQREELQAERNERSFEQEKERLDFLRSRMQSRQEALEQELHKQARQQKQHQAAKGRVFQSRDRSHQKMEKEGQKLCELQQYLREQNLLMLRASLLA
ncbi:uncharacterized protein LOC128897843 [Dryobates pubescens]|uniref:uncharacterized protein LOC128897843 n=1 Tax=Dryobates pubescens TaxID=118200 RepID=UPI0023B913FA|nr:uncharacterized protein LOC128897843 [Dryobates pubescens]